MTKAIVRMYRVKDKVPVDDRKIFIYFMDPGEYREARYDKNPDEWQVNGIRVYPEPNDIWFYQPDLFDLDELE